MDICELEIPDQICERSDLEQLRSGADVLKGLLCCLKDELRQEKNLVETASEYSGDSFVFTITEGYEVKEDTIRLLWNGQERYRVGQGVSGELMWTYELVSPTEGKINFTDPVDDSHIAVFLTLIKEFDCFKNC